MKLIVAVLRKEDEADTIAELNKKGFFVTELATTGGFLKEKNTTLLMPYGTLHFSVFTVKIA